MEDQKMQDLKCRNTQECVEPCKFDAEQRDTKGNDIACVTPPSNHFLVLVFWSCIFHPWHLIIIIIIMVYSGFAKCLTTTGTHMHYGITQCYLPPGRGDVPAITPAEAGTRFSDPRGMQGWVDLDIWSCIFRSLIFFGLPFSGPAFSVDLSTYGWFVWSVYTNNQPNCFLSVYFT